ncbi:hypothetical protein LO80_04495 [Candidatus Francisella endociliophora]|uniref:Uncharacterized protein n=1 Tax=Candidatus Francisella endociliophora TaxID=653937 RepID=A0A097EP11_9GAMM|nr:hypothetical protein [Francisella sp. FSC1006]AIT09299.1 hypothetical protein LO80_04495 [Francisella sp. FSC1006]
MKKLRFLLPTIALTLCYTLANASDVNSNWQDDYSNIKYVTASSIENLNDNTSSIQPTVDITNIIYLYENGPLGKYGPIGSAGPLGKDGPVQKLKSFDPSTYPYFTDYFKSFYGPLSEDGPLGFLGPYTENSYYYGDLFELNNFAVHVRALGLWGVLGTVGPFGPVGALGPLGPIGAHGYSRDEQGNYTDKDGHIVTKIDVPFDSDSKRSFDLYELYKAEYAASKKDLDTSFVTLGNLKENYSDDYVINNDEKQVVTILVIPEQLFNYFDIQLYSSNGNLIAESNSRKYINFIQFLAPKDTNYTIKITSPDKSDKYALYVTGSTKYLNKYNISGDYILEK